jgi:ectoine hydroxylase-related dioxygenase (phytanoyl-CoA dioxygenase family)
MNDTLQPFVVTEANKREYREQGFFVTPPLFEPNLTRRLSDELDSFWQTEVQRTDGSFWTASDGGAPFMTFVPQRNPVIGEIFNHPAMLEIARAMVGPDADLWYSQVVMKQPEVVSAPGYNYAFHQDSFYALDGGWDKDIYLDDCQTFQGWLAVTATTAENGTLSIVPGAHRHGLLEHVVCESGGVGWDASGDPRLDLSQSVPVLLDPGQLLVFSGLLPHGSGVNLSGSARKIIQFSVARLGAHPHEYVYPLLRGGQAVNSAEAALGQH